MPELLELVETTFNPISQSIQYLAEGRGGLCASAIVDDRDGITVLNQLAYLFGVAGLVGQEEAVRRQIRQQVPSGHAVMRLAGG